MSTIFNEGRQFGRSSFFHQFIGVLARTKKWIFKNRLMMDNYFNEHFFIIWGQEGY